MEYITKKRARFEGICGPVNLPYNTILELDAGSGIIFYQGKPLCCATSQNAHDYLARNDDGQGLKRGKLTDAITRRLARKDALHQQRWDKVWADPICQRYRDAEHDDFWVWAHAFYEAPVFDLCHIARLVGAPTQ